MHLLWPIYFDEPSACRSRAVDLGTSYDRVCASIVLGYYRGMKPAIAATLLSMLAITGCATTGAPDYAAETSAGSPQMSASQREALNARIAYYAKTYQVPESLVHAVVQRESKYNPSLRHGPFWGLMQIRHDTARSMGYAGAANGLLDPDINMTYAVAYLANVYKVAGGDEKRAIKLYAGGYYYAAKRQGLLAELHPANNSHEILTVSTEVEPAK